MKQEFSWGLFLVDLPRGLKKLCQVVFDLVSLTVIYLSSVKLVAGNIDDKGSLLYCLLFVSVSLFGFKVTGIYKTVIRFAGVRLLELVSLVQLTSASVIALCSLYFGVQLNFVFLLLLFLLSVFTLAGARLAAREIIYLSRPPGKRLLIYGAGKAGAQLLTSVRQDSAYNVVGFVDDDLSVHGDQLHGLRVFPPRRLAEIVARESISMVVLAMPNASREELRFIMDKLEPLSVIVKKVSTVSNLLDNKYHVEELEEVRIEELLGRERVSPVKELIVQNIFNKVVLVSGAGGSIGSELCRQILACSPKKLILVELSEVALYNIQEELETDWKDSIILVLGSVCDIRLMEHLMTAERVDTVYHAAAYKHVPLVEGSPFAAIQNNVFGTQAILEASIASGVRSFTLISTDKAVRPTNVMGASKRIAEILCQLASASSGSTIRIAMVRFGNVIGSSGSAIPKFREQIKSGGPVTVTHPEITRYFMVVSEAVELVLQASSLAVGGEVFVLDMGSPIKIVDLVKKLIRFSGNVVENQDNLHLEGINIEYIGLRPGEKLYEELLISGDAESTIHSKIKKVTELHPEKLSFEKFIAELRDVCNGGDKYALRDLLSSLDIGYVISENTIVDADAAGNQAKVVNLAEVSKPTEHKYKNDSLVNRVVEKDSPGWKVEKPKIDEEKNTLKFSLGKRLFLGLLHKYFLLSRPLTVGARCVVLSADDEVLLVKHTYVSGWHLPGGGIDPGESSITAVKREVSEETVVKLVGSPKLLGIFHCDEISKRDHVVVFVSRDFTRKSSMVNSAEISLCQFFSVDDLPPDLDKNTRDWITEALKSNL